MSIKEINRSTTDNENLSDFRAMYLNDELYKPTEECEKLSQISRKLSSEFEKTLDDKQRDSYIKVYNALTDEQVQSENEEFIRGFKIAVRLLFDCFR